MSSAARRRLAVKPMSVTMPLHRRVFLVQFPSDGDSFCTPAVVMAISVLPPRDPPLPQTSQFSICLRVFHLWTSSATTNRVHASQVASRDRRIEAVRVLRFKCGACGMIAAAPDHFDCRPSCRPPV